MSQPAIGQKQTTVLLLAMVVLLAAIVAVLVWQNSRPDTPALPAAQVTPNDAAGLTPGMPPANMGSGSTTAPKFDPATAPVVPADMTPAEYVLNYYETCAAEDYKTAFTLLPAATQQTYGTADSFGNTLKGYGISDFSVDPAVEGDGTVTVVGYQVAQGMTFAYEWKFVEGEDGEWLVASRTMAGTK